MVEVKTWKVPWALISVPMKKVITLISSWQPRTTSPCIIVSSHSNTQKRSFKVQQEWLLLRNSDTNTPNLRGQFETKHHNTTATRPLEPQTIPTPNVSLTLSPSHRLFSYPLKYPEVFIHCGFSTSSSSSSPLRPKSINLKRVCRKSGLSL